MLHGRLRAAQARAPARFRRGMLPRVVSLVLRRVPVQSRRMARMESRRAASEPALVSSQVASRPPSHVSEAAVAWGQVWRALGRARERCYP